MSDSTGSQPPGQPEPTSPYGQQPGTPPPYGQQPAGPSPYGQPAPPYGQPEEPPRSFTEQYGQQYGQPAHGQPAYGQPAYGRPQDDRRPGTVTAAGVLTLVFAGLGLLLFGFGLVAVLVARDMMATELESTPGLEGISIDQVVSVAAVTIAVLAVWCLIAIVLAVLAMRRSNGARIGLVVSAVLTALFCGLSLLGAADPASMGLVLVVLAAAVTTVVCLFAGGASDWYARRGRSGAGGHTSAPVA